MSYNDRMKSLWDSNTGDLAHVLKELLELNEEAKKAGDSIDVDFELELFIHANYSLGLGNELPDAIRIASLLKRCTANRVETPNVTRLAAILCSLLLSHITLDVQKNTHTSHNIIASLISPPSTSIPDQLSTMLMVIKPLLSGKLNTWTLEVLSFSLTYIGILQVLGRSEDDYIEELQQSFNRSFSKQELQYLEDWRDNWNDRNDFFRLNCLLITGIHAPDELWLNFASRFYS